MLYTGLLNGLERFNEPLYFQLTGKSYDCLKIGVHCFELAEDVVNSSFLYCNMGRFMRFRAYVDIPEPGARYFL